MPSGRTPKFVVQFRRDADEARVPRPDSPQLQEETGRHCQVRNWLRRRHYRISVDQREIR